MTWIREFRYRRAVRRLQEFLSAADMTRRSNMVKAERLAERVAKASSGCA